MAFCWHNNKITNNVLHIIITINKNAITPGRAKVKSNILAKTFANGNDIEQLPFTTK